MKSHIDNGDQELDNTALESYRKKIIDELGQKSDDKKARNSFNDRNRQFLAPNRKFQRGGFRGGMHNNDQRRNNNFNNNNRNRGFFMERNRINVVNKQREK